MNKVKILESNNLTIEEAENAIRKSLESDNDNQHKAQDYYRLGVLLAKRPNRWKDAEDAFKKSLELDNDNRHQAQVYFGLGTLYDRKTDRWNDAENAFKKSLELDNDAQHKAWVYNSLGLLLTNQINRWEDAEEAFNESLKLKNDNKNQALGYFSLGLLLTKQVHRWKDAEDDFKKSLELMERIKDYSEIVSVNTNYAGLLIKKRQYKDAIKLLQKAIEYEKSPNVINDIKKYILEVEKQDSIRENNIKLKDFQYIQNEESDGQWKISGLFIQQKNLIIGINATGKTRFLKAIAAFAKCINKNDLPDNGTFNVLFEDDKTNASYEYKLKTKDKKIVYETIVDELGTQLVNRENDIAKIYSSIKDELNEIPVSSKELTINVIEDTISYPFIKDIKKWTKEVYLYSFSFVQSDKPFKLLIETPKMLEELLKKDKQKFEESIISDFTKISYPINKIGIIYPFKDIPKIVVQEVSLNNATTQENMSEGMFRALSLIILIEYMLYKNIQCTLLVDDIGEGLDFDRSASIAKLLFEKIGDNNNIQLIITSNDKFLIRSIDIQYLNILDREGGTVKAYNYDNSKEQFDDSIMIGLDGFDLFTSNLYKRPEND
jgi:tetratricopeptide (TPR) repeat protein